jgi:stringent starvation protein B
MQSALESPSTRPYLLRAMYEWCVDSGFTPYVAVMADETVQVPREFVKDGQVVLNIGPDATNGLLIGNEFIEFKARFAGVVREILVPVNRVMAIYARENGQGMAFPAVPATASVPAADKGPRAVPADTSAGSDPSPEPPTTPSGKRPVLTRIK